MPELIGGKWYIKEGDVLSLNAVDAVATENGTFFEVTGTQDADVFFFDQELAEEFRVRYDNDEGPNMGRFYVYHPDYDKMRKKAGLSPRNPAPVDTGGGSPAEPNPFSVQFINEYLDPTAALHSNPFASEEEAQEEAEGLFNIFTGEDSLSQIGTVGQLAEALYKHYSFEALATCECPACWKRRKY